MVAAALAAAISAPATAALAQPLRAHATPSQRAIPLTPAAARQRAAIAGASSLARTRRKPVVIAALTTQTTLVTANPDGSYTMTSNPLPARVSSRGRWQPVSAVLTRGPGGTWSPQATPSRLTLSAGGAGPMAVLTSPDGSRLTLAFPGPLPAPVVRGATATYRNVLPGTDLQLTATTLGGLTQTLIARTPAAASSPVLRRLRIGLASSRGLRIAASRTGTLTATGPHDRPEFTSAAPAAWTDKPAAAGLTTRSSVTSRALTITTAAPAGKAADRSAYISDTLTPDGSGGGNNCSGATCFTEKSTRTPDGSAEVKADCATQTDWDDSSNGVGNQDSYYGTCDGTYRTYYQIDTSELNALSADGTIDVQSAIFTADENFGSDKTCGDTWPLTLHLTNGISSSTDWSNKPADASGDQPATINLKPADNSDSCPSQITASWNNAGYAMTDAVSGNWAATTFGIQGDESASTNGAPDAPGAPSNACSGGDGGGNSAAGYNCGFMRLGDNPDVITTFDITPPAPFCSNTYDTALNGSASSCDTQTIPASLDAPVGSAAGRTDFGCGSTIGWINQTTVKFNVASQAGITGEDVEANTNIWDNTAGGGSVGTTTSAYYPTSGTSNITSGTAMQFTDSSQGGLQDGHAYAWDSWATVNGDGSDNSGNTYSSPRSGTCRFDVDLTAPKNLTVISSQFPASGSGQASQDAGTTGTFTFSAADPVPAGCSNCLASGVHEFTYTLNGGSPVSVYPTAAGSPGATQTYQAQIPIGDWGTNILSVTATDNAGNITTTPVTYTFYAPWNNKTTVTPGDVNGDGIPDLLATTGSNLIDYPGNTDPVAPVQSGSACGAGTSIYNGPCIAGPQSGSPDGTGAAWNTYQITHRGSMTEQGVDDLFAHKGSNLYLVINNPGSNGAAPEYSTANSGSITTIPDHPSCAATADNAANCTGYTTGSWTDVGQILAPGDAWTGSANDNGQPSLLTVENGALWLYQGNFANNLQDPIQLGSSAGATNWSGMTLIAPGTVNGELTIWARNNTTGALYSYPITTDANGLPTLNPGSPGTPVTAASGTLITGLTLPQGTYPAVASPGPLNNSSYPGLYAETTTGTDPVTHLSCANGCLYYYPGQSTSGGTQPPLITTTPPVFVGVLSAPATQLS